MIGGSANRVSAMSVARPARPYGPKVCGAREVQRDQDGEQREGRHRAADVGDVDGQEAAAAEVSQPQRHGQADQGGDRERGHREEQLLEEEVQDPGVARPVGPVGEVAPRVAEDGHVVTPRVQGVRSRCATTRITSSSTASTHAEHRRRQELGPEVGAHPVLDQVAEAAVRHQRADGDQRDRGDGGDPQPGQDHRQRERELDAEQQPALAVPEAGRGLADVVGHRAQALEHAAHQHRQRVEREPDDHGGRREPGERHQQREQRERRDRVDAGADRQDRRLQPRDPPRQEGQREGDHEPGHDRGDGEAEVLDGRVDELAAPVGDVLPADPVVGQPAVAAGIRCCLHE